MKNLSIFRITIIYFLACIFHSPLIANVDWPDTDDIKSYHQVFLVSIGGGSGTEETDKISTLASEFSGYSNVLTAQGTSRGVGPKKMANKIEEIYKEMTKITNSDKKIILILVGKSMGACELHEASILLDERGINIDLFISVDMSCNLGRHYDLYFDGDYSQKKNLNIM